MYLKQLSLEELEEMATECWATIALTTRRIDALLVRQLRQPDWRSFDQYADAEVGIETRIEEQRAVLEGQECDLADIQREIEKRKYPMTTSSKFLGQVKEQAEQARLI